VSGGGHSQPGNAEYLDVLFLNASHRSIDGGKLGGALYQIKGMSSSSVGFTAKEW
jgi:hypothetical protein